MTATLANLRDWFVFADPDPRAETLLFCLPFAGGGASGYRQWVTQFGPEVGVVPVQLPGRESRGTEPPGFDVAEVTDVILARADRPFALYGHSMGAVLAFEITLETQRRGGPRPVHLYLGAGCPADGTETFSQAHTLPDDEFVSLLCRLGGMPPGLLDVPALRELALPVLRADFGWAASWRPTMDALVTIPVTAFAGADDAIAGPSVARSWSQFCVDGLDVHVLPGGHFFPTTQLPTMCSMITRDLT